jgi:hypothetical protein
MGYINPVDQSKEQWLRNNGRDIAENPLTFEIPSEDVLVCLVDNGWMTAAGIAFCREELELFAAPDGRFKIWYSVPRSKVIEICPDVTGKIQ